MRGNFLLCLIFVPLTVLGAQAASQDDQPLPRLSVALHVHSNVSPNGTTPLHQVVALAEKSGVDVLIPTDHFLQRWEAGIPPFTGLLRTTVERSSVMRFKPETYFRMLEKLQKMHPGTLIIPGLEITPSYHWTGDLFQANLTLQDAQRHILALGVPSPEAARRLPVRSNRSMGRFQWKRLLAPGLVFLAGVIIMLKRPVGLFLAVFGLLWAANQRPWWRLSAAVEQFSSNGYEAAQGVIDAVNQWPGLTVWAHPEAENWANRMRLYRGVSMQSKSYPEAILKTRGYTGFAYIWEGEKAVGAPGGLWDQALAEYVQGRRAKAPWAFGELDWVMEGHMGVKLTTVQNVIWGADRTKESVLKKMLDGCFYIFLKLKNESIVLSRWEVAGNKRALSGQEALWTPQSRLRFSMASIPAIPTPMSVQIIRNGQVWKTFEGNLPMNISMPLPAPADPSVSDFYRLTAKGPSRIISNPIFVRQKNQ